MEAIGRRKIWVDLPVTRDSVGFGLPVYPDSVVPEAGGSSLETLTERLRASKDTGEGGECLGMGGLPRGGCIFLNHSSTNLGTLCGLPGGGRRAGCRSCLGCTETMTELVACCDGCLPWYKVFPSAANVEKLIEVPAE